MAIVAGCSGGIPDSRPKPPSAADSAAARAVVLRFGERLQRVPLLAPDSLLRVSLRSEYGAFVTPALLETWLDRPADSPGRLTSSPWPAGIEITDAIEAPHGGTAQIIYVGSVVERTSATPPGGASRRIPVRVTVVRGPEGWRIAQLLQGTRATERAPASPREAIQDTTLGEPSPEHAADLIREYYRAIAERRYPDAYRMWASSGRASGQTLDQFQRGFEGTASVEVDVAPPSRVEGAAGSRYVEVPVLVTARRTDGTRESLGGTYTLRRSVVDGATPEQRAWRISSAKIRRTASQSGSPF
ncbi:MAG TPA: hypothetical protein VFP58_03245 [Candidatus Eisenbacteria bacterium]|nr:hypothetical protein [Candidatus Eisenbacteria bacterium]